MAAVSLIAPMASAVPITVGFSGTMTRVDPQVFEPGLGIGFGSTCSGTYTLDPDTITASFPFSPFGGTKYNLSGFSGSLLLEGASRIGRIACKFGLADITATYRRYGKGSLNVLSATVLELTLDQVSFSKNQVSVELNGTTWSAGANSATIVLSTGTLVCPFIGADAPSTPTLKTRQNNACEDWSGTSQPGDDLRGAILWSADLSFSSFVLTDFQSADLSNSNIHSTNLTAASLAGTDLTDADLSAAFLLGADLTGAVVVNLNLSGAYYDEFTVFPSGNLFDMPPWGLDGGITPWNAGMISLPESSLGSLLAIGALGLAGLATMKCGV